MKGCTKPKDTLMQGTCFVCRQPCDPLAYCHRECAISLSSARELECEKAKVLDLKQVIEEKDKLLKK